MTFSITTEHNVGIHILSLDLTVRHQCPIDPKSKQRPITWSEIGTEKNVCFWLTNYDL